MLAPPGARFTNLLAATLFWCCAGACSADPPTEDSPRSGPDNPPVSEPVTTASDDGAEDEPESEPQLGPSLASYADCLERQESCAAGTDPHCIVDDIDEPSMGFCTSRCDATDQCPVPPGGSAPQICSLGELGGRCVLDCWMGLACPPEMVCLPYGVCGHITPDAPDPYAPCLDCDGSSATCVNTTSGSVCAPEYSSLGCPSPRTSSIIPSPIQVGADFGCGLLCVAFDPSRQCPLGMLCSNFGDQDLCVWPEDPGSCDDFTCGPDETCRVLGGEPICECEEGFFRRPGGGCEGPDTSPCDPNPCQPPATRCFEFDGEAVCTCLDPDAQPPYCDPDCPATHFDGDEHEPNDCAVDARVVGPGDASVGVSRVFADISPTSEDLDYWRQVADGGTYWLLLEASEQMCSLHLDPMPSSPEFGDFDYAAQFSADAFDEPWSCQRVDGQEDQPSYSFALLHFQTESDLPSQPEASATDMREISDTFEDAEDVDAFSFEAQLPFDLVLSGQAASVHVEVRNLAGDLLDETTRDCGFSLEPVPCFDVDGDGDVMLTVTLQEDPSAEQRELRAWRVGW